MIFVIVWVFVGTLGYFWVLMGTCTRSWWFGGGWQMQAHDVSESDCQGESGESKHTQNLDWYTHTLDWYTHHTLG